jgi:hypothetical protein
VAGQIHPATLAYFQERAKRCGRTPDERADLLSMMWVLWERYGHKWTNFVIARSAYRAVRRGLPFPGVRKGERRCSVRAGRLRDEGSVPARRTFQPWAYAVANETLAKILSPLNSIEQTVVLARLSGEVSPARIARATGACLTVVRGILDAVRARWLRVQR